MVSLNTIFTLGVIGAGLLAFTSLGGAGGIGSRIGSSFGGGIRSFNENISSSFNAALEGLNPLSGLDPLAGLSGLNPFTDTNEDNNPLPEPYKAVGAGGAVDTSPIDNATPEQTTPTPEVITGKSYLERTLQYVQQPLTTLTHTQAARNVISRAKSDYGGYGSAASQNAALQSILATNAQKYGSYFN
jgi:hypothetical protein